MKGCPTNHRVVERLSASIAENLRAEGGCVLIEKAVCKDCGVYIFRRHLVSLDGEWSPRPTNGTGDRLYACVALRKRSA